MAIVKKQYFPLLKHKQLNKEIYAMLRAKREQIKAVDIVGGGIVDIRNTKVSKKLQFFWEKKGVTAILML